MIIFKSMLKRMVALSFWRATMRSCYQFWGPRVLVGQPDPVARYLVHQEELGRQDQQDILEQTVILGPQDFQALQEALARPANPEPALRELLGRPDQSAQQDPLDRWALRELKGPLV